MLVRLCIGFELEEGDLWCGLDCWDQICEAKPWSLYVANVVVAEVFLIINGHDGLGWKTELLSFLRA